MVMMNVGLVTKMMEHCKKQEHLMNLKMVGICAALWTNKIETFIDHRRGEGNKKGKG